VTSGNDRPAWIAQGQAWVSAKLDKQIDAFNRKLVNDGRLSNDCLSQPNDNEKARRERGLAKTQEWKLELALRQAEQGNIESLQKQNPGLARFINLPRLGRGEHFEKPPHPARDRLENALAELQDARTFLRSYYKLTGRPRGQLTAEQILAERWNLDEKEIRRRCISRSRLKRENFVRSK
jgi:hypothetical protein